MDKVIKYEFLKTNALITEFINKRQITVKKLVVLRNVKYMKKKKDFVIKIIYLNYNLIIITICYYKCGINIK